MNSPDYFGLTPLHIASRDGFQSIVQILIQKGAELNIQENHQWTPLHYASRYGHNQIVELMLSAKCEIGPKDDRVFPVDILKHLFIMLAKKDIYLLFGFLLIKKQISMI